MERGIFGDPFELGSSRPLDFGHWAAHKLEGLSSHRLRHGEAVAIGMALDTRYGVEAGLLFGKLGWVVTDLGLLEDLTRGAKRIEFGAAWRELREGWRFMFTDPVVRAGFHELLTAELDPKQSAELSGQRTPFELESCFSSRGTFTEKGPRGTRRHPSRCAPECPPWR